MEPVKKVVSSPPVLSGSPKGPPKLTSRPLSQAAIPDALETGTSPAPQIRLSGTPKKLSQQQAKLSGPAKSKQFEASPMKSIREGSVTETTSTTDTSKRTTGKPLKSTRTEPVPPKPSSRPPKSGPKEIITKTTQPPVKHEAAKPFLKADLPSKSEQSEPSQSQRKDEGSTTSSTTSDQSQSQASTATKSEDPTVKVVRKMSTLQTAKKCSKRKIFLIVFICAVIVGLVAFLLVAHGHRLHTVSSNSTSTTMPTSDLHTTTKEEQHPTP